MLRSLLIALAQQLFRMAMRPSTRQALPQILSRVDAELPHALGDSPTPASVERVFSRAIGAAIVEPALPAEVKAVIGLYDPVVTAFKLLQR
jgi:hypothetical protein